MSTKKKGLFHYSWIVVAGGFIVMGLLHSMLQTCFSLFLVPVTTEMDIPRTAFSICSSIVALVTMLLSPKIGKLLGDHSKTRLIFTVSVIGMGISYASYSLAQNIYHMYISAAFVGVFSCGAVIMPVSIIIANWFVKSRGTAMSIAFAGSGIFGSIISPILTNIITNNGWRTAFLYFGIAMIVIEAPIAFFIMKPSPSLMGLKPYGADEDEEVSSSAKKADKKPSNELNVTLAELKKQKFFYIYLLGIFAMCVAGFGSLGQLSASLTDSYGATFSASIISFFLLVLTPAKISLGWIYDKLGARFGTVYVLSFYAVAFALLQITGNETLMWVMSVFFAVGISSGTVSPSVVTAATFGPKDYGTIFGFVNFFAMGASVIGSPMLASVYDSTGSYRIAWAACLALCLLSIVCIVYADMRCKKVFASHVSKS